MKKKRAFVQHVVARVKKELTVPPHLEIVIRQKGIDADVSQSATYLSLDLVEQTSLILKLSGTTFMYFQDFLTINGFHLSLIEKRH